MLPQTQHVFYFNKFEQNHFLFGLLGKLPRVILEIISVLVGLVFIFEGMILFISPKRLKNILNIINDYSEKKN